jgi:hypothetical protein|tara:strand:+ start:15769 stop:16020 length:252 start_codon:yes stop_codon:yes gene_type:complete
MIVRRTIGATSGIITLNTTNGRITLGGVNGTIALLIDDSDNTLSPGLAYFDFVPNDGTDELPPLFGGVLEFVRTVTLQGGADA